MNAQQFIALIQEAASDLENVDDYQDEPEVDAELEKEFARVWTDR